MTSTAALQRALDRAVRDRDRYLEERNERILALHELDAVKAENERLQTQDPNQTITATPAQLLAIAETILVDRGALVEITDGLEEEPGLPDIHEGDLYVVQGDARTLVGRDGDVRTVTP